MPESRTCPKCGDCDHDEPRHHWMRDGATMTGIICRNCPAIAIKCNWCSGSRLVVDDDGTVIDCRACQYQGVVEVVAISREEVDRLRAVNARLLVEAMAFEAELWQRFHVCHQVVDLVNAEAYGRIIDRMAKVLTTDDPESEKDQSCPA